MKTEYLGELDPSNKIEAHIEKVEELWQQNKHLKDNALLKTVLKSNLCKAFYFTAIRHHYYYHDVYVHQSRLGILLHLLTEDLHWYFREKGKRR